MNLWYLQPATVCMNEALPIGNGRLGAMVFGEVEREHIVLNEDSLWTGDENPSGEDGSMGAYQVLGSLYLSFPAPVEPGKAAPQISDYRRELSLSSAVARTQFTRDGISYQREAFVSAADQAIVVRCTASRNRSFTGTITLAGAHSEKTSTTAGTLSFNGALANGIRYETAARVVTQGGNITSEDDKLVLNQCDEVMVVIAAGTNYVMDYASAYRGADPHRRVIDQLKSASAKNFESLKAAHVRNFQSLFNRVSLDLGKSTDTPKALPIDQRKLMAFNEVDPELEALLFQYGRYLLISSSRPGSLPANLQGIWNDSNKPAWHSDYHSNINIEMNYWPAESTGLGECHRPFFDLIRSQLPAWRKATAASPDYITNTGAPAQRGFAIRTSHNITGGMGWKWDTTANAWYCQHLWEHFAFSQDKIYLREVAYPMLKETVEFWEDHLKTMDDGRLVVPHGWSPEHGPTEDGVSYNQEIVWDLFTNYIEASEALGVDESYRAKVALMRGKLVTPTVGSWGQLQEWITDRDDPKDHHRHTSHLFGVFPGRQISMEKTPELAKGAKISLDARGIDPGSDVREWSFAWRTALYARLGDGDDAHRMLQQLFSKRNTCVNLFGLHPPMQIDGNFGITAAMAEMLVQSQEGEIVLLPALPNAWPSGQVTGLRARGGFGVDVKWSQGRLESATIHGVGDTGAMIRYGSKKVQAVISTSPVVLDRELRTVAPTLQDNHDD